MGYALWNTAIGFQPVVIEKMEAEKLYMWIL
jgi:hypothetical protein